MKLKIGDFSIELPHKEFLEKYGRMENPFGTKCSKANQDFYDSFFKMARSSFTNYFEEYKKWMEKYAEKSKSNKSDD